MGSNLGKSGRNHLKFWPGSHWIKPRPLRCGWIRISLQKPLKLAGFTDFLVIFSASPFGADGATSYLLSNLGYEWDLSYSRPYNLLKFVHFSSNLCCQILRFSKENPCNSSIYNICCDTLYISWFTKEYWLKNQGFKHSMTQFSRSNTRSRTLKPFLVAPPISFLQKYSYGANTHFCSPGAAFGHSEPGI